MYNNLLCSPLGRVVGDKNRKGRFRSGGRGPLNAMSYLHFICILSSRFSNEALEMLSFSVP